MKNKNKRLYPKIKRVLDFCMALPALILLSPLFLGIAIAVKADSRGPVFFSQKRVGRGGRIFTIYKFRTMKRSAPPFIPAREENNREGYITRVGATLRRTGLDELPQLFNVLRGDMSLIGPRPLIVCEKKLHEFREALGVYTVYPGITGWAQINCDSIRNYREKAEYDGEYIKRMSFCFDCKIFFKTVAALFCGKKLLESISDSENAILTEERKDI